MQEHALPRFYKAEGQRKIEPGKSTVESNRMHKRKKQKNMEIFNAVHGPSRVAEKKME